MRRMRCRLQCIAKKFLLCVAQILPASGRDTSMRGVAGVLSNKGPAYFKGTVHPHLVLANPGVLQGSIHRKPV